jgi:hypothetical protein
VKVGQHAWSANRARVPVRQLKFTMRSTRWHGARAQLRHPKPATRTPMAPLRGSRSPAMQDVPDLVGRRHIAQRAYNDTHARAWEAGVRRCLALLRWRRRWALISAQSSVHLTTS